MRIFILILASVFVYQVSSAQGCVAIRSNGGGCSIDKAGDEKGWKFNMNQRYFRSYKHFVGKTEQKHRVDSLTQVINHSFSLDLTAVKTFNSRWSAALSIPVISNTRSSKYEHYGNASKSARARRATNSFGLGDARATIYYWLFDPKKFMKGNIQAGLGLKLPTGDYRYTGYFYSNDTTAVVGPVDQSIQLGDGGLGIITELRTYYNFTHSFGVYGDFYYMSNPREQNGVSTARGGTSSTNSIKYTTNVMSVPDQYMVRAGANYMAKQFTFSGGVRIEGIPSSDIIGGDRGFRRPGYVISAEPAVSYTMKKAELYFSVPFALERNRTQSYADKLQTAATGNKVQGDAAFADYLINIGLKFKI